MKRILDATALALVWALGVGVTLLGPSPAQAATCVRVAALDLNGDGWIDTPERHAAMNAGFSNIRSGGRLFTTAEEMSTCLQGSQHAFKWLQQSNPNYASYVTESGASASPTAATGSTLSSAGIPAPSTMPGSSYDRGAAFDTPTPQAAAEAKAYLESKTIVGPDGTMTEVGRSTPAPIAAPPADAQPLMPSANPGVAASPDFSQMDTNQDGVVSRQEYLDYMSRTGHTY